MSDGLASALRAAAAKLDEVSNTARLDAELLMAFALNMSREQMLLRQRDFEPPAGFQNFVDRRMASEPVAYITGEKDFWDLTLRVTPDVLIPRPDSETLVEAAAELFAERPPQRILDLGTGSGALLLAALSVFPEAQGDAIDSEIAALEIARANARLTKFEKRASFHHASWNDDGWSDLVKVPYDLILSNPPYIENQSDLPVSVAKYEPVSALYSGDDGLDDYNSIIPQLSALLSDSGTAILEIGSRQGAQVTQIAENEGFNCEIRKDLAGLDRAVILRR